MKTPTASVTPTVSTLSDDQMQALAKAFHDIAVKIGDVRLSAIAAGSKLTDPLIVQLQGYVFTLMNTASGFALQAANITLASADQAVSQIAAATQTATKALDKLQKIDKAVNIASSVVVLAMAISTKDPEQIFAASKSVITAAGVAA